MKNYLYVPALHCVHVASPALLISPVFQGVQDESPAFEYSPALQVIHVVAPIIHKSVLWLIII